MPAAGIRATKKQEPHAFWHSCLLLLAVLPACCAQPGPPGRCVLGLAAELPLTFVDGHLLMPVIIDGAGLKMALDTGASLTSLTRTGAGHLGVVGIPSNLLSTGIGGTQRVSYFVAKTIELGRLHGERQRIVVGAFDLSGPHAEVDGLFGTDFLASYDLDLDLPGHRALIYTVNGACDGPVTALDGALYPVAMSKSADSIPHGAFAEIVIGGKKLAALVDTGSPHSVLFRDAARRVGLSLSELRGDPRFYVSGTGPQRVAAVSHKLAPVQVGDITVQNLPVVIVDQHSAPGMDMILGMDFLSRVHVWFDFHSSTLVMQYPPRPSPPNPSPPRPR